MPSLRKWAVLGLAIALPTGLAYIGGRGLPPRPADQGAAAATPDHQPDSGRGHQPGRALIAGVKRPRFIGTVTADGQVKALFLLPGHEEPWVGVAGQKLPGTTLLLEEIRDQRPVLVPVED
jgi:hypothetical protein